MDLVKKWWYLVYILIVIAIGASITVPFINHAPTEPKVTGKPNAPIDALRFYSSGVSPETNAHIATWLIKSDISFASDNLTVRKSSYSESTYRRGNILYKDVSFYIDTKTPKLSFKVYIQKDLSSSESIPPTFITCAQGSQQKGDLAQCEELVKI